MNHRDFLSLPFYYTYHSVVAQFTSNAAGNTQKKTFQLAMQLDHRTRSSKHLLAVLLGLQNLPYSRELFSVNQGYVKPFCHF